MIRAEQLGGAHRVTLAKLFSHPGSGNIEWRDVRSLLDAVANVTEEHNGKLKVSLCGETEVIQPPRGKNIDRELIVDLRRMLKRTGLVGE